MSGFYEIEISNGEGYRIDERSGVYFGDLKEILPRISDGIDTTSYITVKKIKTKLIDMSAPKKSVSFYCYDDNLKKELDFCTQGIDKDYFTYIPEEIIKEFKFQDKVLKVGDFIVFRDEYKEEKHCGKILWLNYDNDTIKVLDGCICHTIPVTNVLGVM